MNGESVLPDNVGFIGLGIMGAPMVRNLLEGGFAVTVWNRTAARSAAAEQAGARVASSPAEVAASSDVTITCVTATDDVAQVLIGADGMPPAVIEGVRAGGVVIDMSTISPAATREFGAQLAERGVAMLDAPISGGEQGAVAGTLSIMVGGDADVLERVLPLLEAMGSQITHCGPLGSGQTVKLCNQIAVCINNLAMAESLLFCEASGVDPGTMLQAISAGAAGSWQISNLGGAGRWARLPTGLQGGTPAKGPAPGVGGSRPATAAAGRHGTGPPAVCGGRAALGTGCRYAGACQCT